jgi:hypothetical protein
MGCLKHYFLALLLCSMVLYGQSIQNPYYAGGNNPLVTLGGQRVWNGIHYPDWFQYPAIPTRIRQQLIDDYTTREFLASFDRSARDAPATKYNDAVQLIFDLLSAYGLNDGSIRSSPTQQEINDTVRHQLIPQLVKPREQYELDSPSSNEAASSKEGDYEGQNGDEIKLLDKEVAYLARHNNIPTGYRPGANDAYNPPSMTPSERQAFERNQGQIRRETLPKDAAKPKDKPKAPVASKQSQIQACQATWSACYKGCGTKDPGTIGALIASLQEEARCGQRCAASQDSCLAKVK